MLRVSVASDHRGFQVKLRLLQALRNESYDVTDEGCYSDEVVDYPDYAKAVAEKITRGEVDRGILICGTGIGMAICANKFPGVRAAACYDEVMIEISRRHNDLNVLCLPGDLFDDRPVDDLVLTWLRTEFEGGRHLRRIEKLNALHEFS